MADIDRSFALAPYLLAATAFAAFGYFGPDVYGEIAFGDLEEQMVAWPAVAGTHRLQIDDAGAYGVFANRDDSDDEAPIAVSVRFEGLEEELLERTGWGDGVFTFQAATPGTYVVEIVDAGAAGPNDQIVVAPITPDRLLNVLAIAGLMWVVGYGGALVVFIVGVRRQRAG